MKLSEKFRFCPPVAKDMQVEDAKPALLKVFEVMNKALEEYWEKRGEDKPEAS
jgi:hypothetical protein